jgi:hypothetical protein
VAIDQMPDLILQDAAAQAGYGGNRLTSQSPDEARLNLVMGYANLVLAGVDAGAPQLVQRLVSYTGTEGMQLFSKLDRTTLQKVLRGAQSGATGQSPEWIEAMQSLKQAAGNDQGLYERLVNALKGAGNDRLPPGGGAPELVTEGGPSLRNAPGSKGQQPSHTMRSQGKEQTPVPSPKSGDQSKLRNVVEEEPTDSGRWFARYNKETGEEIFSVRIEDGKDAAGNIVGKEAQISWIETGYIRQVANNLAEVQAEIGENITRVYGNASDGVRETILQDRFNSALYEKNLARRLGGKWRVETIRKAGTGGKGQPEAQYTIEATRIGD